MIARLIQGGEGLIQGIQRPVDLLAGLPHVMGGLVMDLAPLAGQFCRQAGNLLQCAGDGLHMAHWVQRGEGALEGLLELPGGNQPGHIGHILLQIVQLLFHGLAVGADELNLGADGGDGICQGVDGLAQAAVRLLGQLFQLAQQGVGLIQSLLELIACLVAEPVQVLQKGIQAIADSGGMLV